MTELERMLIAYIKENGFCKLCSLDNEDNSSCDGCCSFCDKVECDCYDCREFNKYKFDIKKLKKYLGDNKIEW